MVNGVRIVAEIDQPGHASAGWMQLGASNKERYGTLTICNSLAGTNWVESGVEPPTGQFNPVNERVHEILKDLYDELVGLFSSPIIHLGGDEIQVGSDDPSAPSCWNSTSKAGEILEYLDENNLPRGERDTFMGLFANFTKRSIQQVEESYKAAGKELDRMMMWAIATDTEYVLPGQPKFRHEVFAEKEKYMFQVWDQMTNMSTPSSAAVFMNDEYDVVLSNPETSYLDCGAQGWVGLHYWCPYVLWQDVYDAMSTFEKKYADLVPAKKMKAHLKGQELTMWTEMYNSDSVPTRVWPRGAALGESLWSNLKTGWRAADARFNYNIYRMQQAGIHTGIIQPQWCAEHGLSCTV
mmetsp:Transcript_23048/g.36704  ORF Transcript_23048/g.36704 Transcript_23048/m.36704 type:complete len:352 (+) Transcript_23048:2082-3137(+)